MTLILVGYALAMVITVAALGAADRTVERSVVRRGGAPVSWP